MPSSRLPAVVEYEQKLALEVQKRQCLYNKATQGYYEPETLKAQWNEVAEEVGADDGGITKPL